MLIVKKVSTATPGKEIPFTIRGEEVSVTVRPFNSDIVRALKKKHRKEEALTNAIIDHVLESFSGFGDETGVPFPMNLETKKVVMEVQGLDDTNYANVGEFVFAEARKLTVEVREEEEKN